MPYKASSCSPLPFALFPELLHTTAHLTAVAATKGDGGDGGATRPKMAGGGGGLRARGDDATGHGRARERGQTEEENTGKVYMSFFHDSILQLLIIGDANSFS